MPEMIFARIVALACITNVTAVEREIAHLASSAKAAEPAQKPKGMTPYRPVA
jgi:hypothetical protein